MRHQFYRTKVLCLICMILFGCVSSAEAEEVENRSIDVGGHRLFYREAGDVHKPVMLLLHGFPSSSYMFRKLIPELAPFFHVIAPDYPGMGNSDAPAAEGPALTFDTVAQSIGSLMQQLHITGAVIYMQDFGGPVGMRLATWHPEWVRGLIIQNSPISLDGWDPVRLKAVQANDGSRPAAAWATAQARVAMSTDFMLHHDGARYPDRLDPDAWTNDAYAIGDTAKRKAMTELQLDIGSNLALYPEWQRYLRKVQPKTLVVWGDNDPIFVPQGADAINSFVPGAHVYHYNTGHFALEEDYRDISRRIVQVFPHS